MRRRLAAALGAILALALAGCGSDGDDTAERAAVPDGFFGVTPQNALTDDDFARMAEGGVETLRVLLPWNAVDPGPETDDLDFSTIDPVIANAARHGIEPLVYLAGMPTWAAALDGCETGCGGIPAPQSPQTLAAWRELVAAASERYGPGGTLWREQPELPEQPVRLWQIWNEQNSATFFAPNPDVEAFARMLTAAEAELRKRDPEATVILGGLQPAPLGSKRRAIPAWDFLRQLYEIDGIAERFDGVAIHPYAAQVDGVAAELETIHREIERSGDDAGIWVTEIGWSSGDGAHPLERGPEQQADRLSDAYTLMADNQEEWNLRGVFWFSWRDRTTDAVCEWCAYSGLFEQDALEPKPAWDALTAFTGGS
ncbi:MAG TPA: glycosyl hydrolase [Solirubrobacterales bacterium]|nr:glycosyl hydrolase [Solirubrobacterales bacterium]